MANVKEDLQSTGPLNTAGGGGVDGIGIGPKGEPGVYPKKKKLRALFPMLKRRPLRGISRDA